MCVWGGGGGGEGGVGSFSLSLSLPGFLTETTDVKAQRLILPAVF